MRYRRSIWLLLSCLLSNLLPTTAGAQSEPSSEAGGAVEQAPR
jgi:hypothetical protein